MPNFNYVDSGARRHSVISSNVMPRIVPNDVIQKLVTTWILTQLLKILAILFVINFE